MTNASVGNRLAALCRGLGLSLFGAVLALAVGSTHAAADGCANEAVREQQNATRLPECRAYELVTQADKGGASVFYYAPLPGPAPSGVGGVTGAVRADGGAVVYRSILPLPGSPSGLNQSWKAERGPGGWLQEPISPAAGVAHPYVGLETVVENTDPGYSVFFANTFDTLDSADTSATAGSPNGYVRGEDGRWRLIAPQTGSWAAGTVYVGSSADGNVVLLESKEDVGAAAAKDPEHSMLWSWDRRTESLAPVVVDSGGAAIDQCGGSFASGFHGNTQRSTPFRQAISADGSRIVFATPGIGGSIWAECGEPAHSRVLLRIDGERTIDVSRSRLAVPEAPQQKMFAGADTGLEHVLFYSAERLLEGAAPGGGLYRFDVADESLSYLTPPVSGEAQIEQVYAVSNDGTKAFFLARGDLDPAVSNKPGDQALFLYSDGKVTKLAPGATAALRDGESSNQVGFSPNGRWLAFTSTADPTGQNPGGLPQVYLYDTRDGVMRCASCPAGGLAASSAAALPLESVGPLGGQVPVPRFLTDDGRVYFDAAGRLLPGDGNGRIDVYAYSDSGGLQLISSGAGAGDAALVGISASGDDVFLSTSNTLVGRDTDGGDTDIYDARVGGGSLEPEVALPSCAGEECLGAPPAAPGVGRPGSATAHGSVQRARHPHRRAKCRQRRGRSGGHAGTRARKKAAGGAHGRCAGKTGRAGR